MRHRAALTAALTIMLLAATACAAVPAPERATAAAVIAHLRAAGLPIEGEVIFDADSDPNKLLGRPNGYTEKAQWRDQRVPRDAAPGVPQGGGVEIFGDSETRLRRQEYIAELGKGTPLFVEYLYGKGRVLLRISKELTPTHASDYERALASLVGS